MVLTLFVKIFIGFFLTDPLQWIHRKCMELARLCFYWELLKVRCSMDTWHSGLDTALRIRVAGFESQFHLSLPLMCRQQVMAQGSELWTPVWESWIEFPTLALTSLSPGCYWHLGNEIVSESSLSLSLYPLCLSI